MNQATLTGRPILYILWIGRKLNILIPNSRYILSWMRLNYCDTIENSRGRKLMNFRPPILQVFYSAAAGT